MKCNVITLLVALSFLCSPPLLVAAETAEGEQEVTSETETGEPTVTDETDTGKENGEEKEKTGTEEEEPDCE